MVGWGGANATQEAGPRHVRRPGPCGARLRVRASEGAPCRPKAGPQVTRPATFSKRTKFQSECTKAYENFAGLQNELAKKIYFYIR